MVDAVMFAEDSFDRQIAAGLELAGQQLGQSTCQACEYTINLWQQKNYIVK